MIKVKDKERNLKAAKEKQLVTYKTGPIDCQLISKQKYFIPEGTGTKYSKWWKQGTTMKSTLSSEAMI